MPHMPCLRVEIVAFVDEYQPGIVRCTFVDAEGKRHTFIEKVPVVTAQNLWSDSDYPQKGTVPCDSVQRSNDATGRRLACVTIDVCDSMDLPRHSAQYVVLESQLTDC